MLINTFNENGSHFLEKFLLIKIALASCLPQIISLYYFVYQMEF